MTDGEEHPCARGITAECFRTHPQWARQALAVRLIHAITPKQLSKRLPPSINKALLVPGMSFPPGFGPGDFPPGAIITPQTVFPPGWTAGDPLPPGAAAPPTTAPQTSGASVVPPFYLGPGAPVYPTGQGAAPGVEYWFSDAFKNLTAGSWTDVSEAGGSASIVAGALKLVATAAVGDAGVRRTEARSWPANWTWTFAFKYESGTGTAYHEIYTGSYHVKIAFIQPTTIQLSYKWGTINFTVDNYVNLAHVWKLVMVGQTGSLYRDDVLVRANNEFMVSASFPGRTMIYHDENGTSYTDYMIIEDNTA